MSHGHINFRQHTRFYIRSFVHSSCHFSLLFHSHEQTYIVHPLDTILFEIGPLFAIYTLVLLVTRPSSSVLDVRMLMLHKRI